MIHAHKLIQKHLERSTVVNVSDVTTEVFLPSPRHMVGENTPKERPNEALDGNKLIGTWRRSEM